MAYATGKAALDDRWTLNAGSAFAMRSAELSELYSDDTYLPVARFGNSYVEGLSTLKPEKNLQFDLGITYQEERVRSGVRGFYATIWDYIMPVPAGIDMSAAAPVVAPHVLGRDFRDFPPQWREDLGTVNENADTAAAAYQYVNVELATLFGGDMFAEVTLWDGVSVFGSMAYVRGTNHDPVAFVADPSWSSPDGTTVPLGRSEGLPLIYPLSGTLSIRVFDPDAQRWGLEFASRMVRRQDHLAYSLSELSTAGFAVFDLRGYYRLRERCPTDGRHREPVRSQLHGTRLVGDPRARRAADVPAGARNQRDSGGRRPLLTRPGEGLLGEAAVRYPDRTGQVGHLFQQALEGCLVVFPGQTARSLGWGR